MAIKSLFMGSINGDRKYKAAEFAQYFALFIANGVYARDGDFAVTTNGDMTVTIAPGACFVNGYQGINETSYTFEMPVADAVLNRIDRLVFRLDHTERLFKFVVLQGTPATTPQAPAIVRNADYYDLCLIERTVPKGSISVLQTEITPTLLNNDICGIVHGLIDQVQTTAIFSQIVAELARFKAENEADFVAWFATIQDILNESAAGNLLALITALQDGTTPAGDAAKLGGQTPEYYGKAEDVTAAATAAANAQTAATAANNNAGTRMPIAGGTFTGTVLNQVADVYDSVKRI
ncbi:MAG: hypothetical protein ACK5L3_15225, partial [Oscillospiraceae bacterium]